MTEEDTGSLEATETPDVEEGPDRVDAEREGVPPDPDEVARVAAEFLAGLVGAMGVEAKVDSSVEGPNAFVDITGEGLGSLIGRRGQTLDALQELARTAVQRRLEARVRLLVDV